MWLKKYHWWAMSGVLTLGLLLTSTALYFQEKKMDPLHLVEQQLLALKSGNVKLAYSYTTTAFQSASSLRSFERFVYAYPTLDKFQRAELKLDRQTDKAILVRGKLFSNQGLASLAIFDMLKENDQWKIQRITMTKSDVDIYHGDSLNALSKNFDNKDDHYRINYPVSWSFNETPQGTLTLNGKPGTPSFQSSVNIQTVFTKRTGGHFSNIDEFMTEVKTQAAALTVHPAYIKSGPIVVRLQDGQRLRGEYLVFTYQANGQVYKQWQIVVLRQDKQVFYTWAFSAPVAQYDKDLPIAQAMLRSWSIY